MLLNLTLPLFTPVLYGLYYEHQFLGSLGTLYQLAIFSNWSNRMRRRINFRFQNFVMSLPRSKSLFFLVYLSTFQFGAFNAKSVSKYRSWIFREIITIWMKLHGFSLLWWGKNHILRFIILFLLLFQILEHILITAQFSSDAEEGGKKAQMQVPSLCNFLLRHSDNVMNAFFFFLVLSSYIKNIIKPFPNLLFNKYQVFQSLHI